MSSKILPIITLSIAGLLQTGSGLGQCAVFVNQLNGAMVWAYNSRNGSYMLDEIPKMARKECKPHSKGYNCELLNKKQKESGWCCLIRGYNGGLYCFAGSFGNDTEPEAITKPKKNFNNQFGIIEYDQPWIIYVNSKYVANEN